MLSEPLSQHAGSNRDVEYFQELADGAPVMIWMSGADMGCFYFNRAWLDFRGRTLQEEFGNGWAEGVQPDDLERCVQHYVSSFERREAFAMSYRLRHHTGEFPMDFGSRGAALVCRWGVPGILRWLCGNAGGGRGGADRATSAGVAGDARLCGLCRAEGGARDGARFERRRYT